MVGIRVAGSPLPVVCIIFITSIPAFQNSGIPLFMHYGIPALFSLPAFFAFSALFSLLKPICDPVK